MVVERIGGIPLSPPPQALARVQLDSGQHSKPTQGMCVMEMASLLAKEKFTDHPTCVNEVITRAAQRVNDSVSEEDRQRLKKLLPRIMRCRRTTDDKRINVRLAIYCAKSVERLVHGRNKRQAREAIEAAEKWLRGEATQQECSAAYAAAYAYASAAADAFAADAYAYASAAYAYAAADAYASAAAYAFAAADASADAFAAAADAYASSAAAAAAAAAERAGTHDRVLWLSDLIDAWEKAAAEEGEALWEPKDWEDDLIAFAEAVDA